MVNGALPGSGGSLTVLRLLQVLGLPGRAMREPWVRLGSSPLLCCLGPEPTCRCLLAGSLRGW